MMTNFVINMRKREKLVIIFTWSKSQNWKLEVRKEVKCKVGSLLLSSSYSFCFRVSMSKAIRLPKLLAQPRLVILAEKHKFSLFIFKPAPTIPICTILCSTNLLSTDFFSFFFFLRTLQ